MDSSDRINNRRFNGKRNIRCNHLSQVLQHHRKLVSRKSVVQI